MRENGHGTVLARSGRVGASTGMTRVLDQTSNPTGPRSDAERPRVAGRKVFGTIASGDGVLLSGTRPVHAEAHPLDAHASHTPAGR